MAEGCRALRFAEAHCYFGLGKPHAAGAIAAEHFAIATTMYARWA